MWGKGGQWCSPGLLKGRLRWHSRQQLHNSSNRHQFSSINRYRGRLWPKPRPRQKPNPGRLRLHRQLDRLLPPSNLRVGCLVSALLLQWPVPAVGPLLRP